MPAASLLEVKDAILYGLHSNVTQLEKLLKTSCGDKGCCNYNAEKNKLNDANETLKKHLNEEKNPSKNLDNILTECKLNDLDGPLNQLNKEITEKIQELEKDIEELKKEQNDDNKSKNASVIDKLSKSLDSHQTSMKSLETLNKLCAFAEKINENHDNTKKLLESLCTGLEKFLGYQDGNYTGEGIVYSDLDRLCDGVMSFLHGVLNDVHTNDNLQKYNTPLTVPLQKITEALYNRKNFDSSIRVVSDGIKQWVRGVDEKHREVMRPLEELKESLSGHMETEMNDISITDQLLTWQGFAGLYLQKALQSERALRDIDDGLSRKIACKIELLKQVMQNFWDAVNNDDVKNSVNELRKDKHLKYITSAVQSAKKLAKELLSEEANGFTQGYKEKITEKFSEIKTRIEEFTNDGNGGGSNKSELWTQFESVQSKVGELQSNVLADLDSLRGEIDELDDTVYSNPEENELVKEALSKLGTAKSTLDLTTGDITATSTSLKSKYERDLNGKFETLIEKFPTFKNVVFGDGGTSSNPDENSLAKLITKLTTVIGNTGDISGYGLVGAVNAFNNAARLQIQNAAKKAIEEAIGRFQMEDNGDEPKIKVAQLMKLFEASRMELSAAVQKIQVELNDLKKLPEAVNSEKESAGAYMAELKQRIESIQSRIQGIDRPIGTATSVIQAAISLLEISIKDAESNAQVVTSALRIDLQKRVGQAFDDLDEHVQKMFDAQKKAELKALSTSVSSQIPKIQDSIDDDMDAGLKGLMNKLKAVFPSLTNSAKDLQTAANRVKSFYDKFLNALNEQSDLTTDANRITTLQDALLQVLSTMNTKQHFHQEVSDKIDALNTALHNFTPRNSPTPLPAQRHKARRHSPPRGATQAVRQQVLGGDVRWSTCGD
ncbi:hypothetical protein, conserved [Babesia ovata]|uniref:Extracellular matrix-binding ebh n=1 Tax=Babesia ovata TaxID=189622 RepID=A0A2H6KIX3_9APIC|nr:uncharacterized protein BOVATA_044220 [Babesia ovata]GBE62929.1 hypothetical protein, conserved [Babesia ovata]